MMSIIWSCRYDELAEDDKGHVVVCNPCEMDTDIDAHAPAPAYHLRQRSCCGHMDS